jgi:choline dehydrogenase
LASHDYVIVGAGSAGAVLAARLSESAGTRVLVVEAGPDYRAGHTPPQIHSLHWLDAIGAPGSHWPTLAARLTDAHEPMLYLRGRGVGGSSAINASGAVRGLPADYDRWAAAGCRGWAWEDVLPSFIRLESDRDYGDHPYHGSDGPIPVSRFPPEEWGPVSRAFCEAALDLGHSWCPDINAPDGSGVYPGPLTADGGRRVSTNDAYLEAARDRPNLTVWGETCVERIAFEGQRAVGLRVRSPDGEQFLEAGEVVLAAGAIGSPAILLRSGVGPADDLRALGIEVVADLPGVGQNLADHPMVALSLQLTPEAQAPTSVAYPYGCGLRTSSGMGTEDLGLFPASYELSRAEGGLWAALLDPSSRGRLRLVSPDPGEEPVIEFNMLSVPEDAERLRDGLRMLFDLARHPALGALTTEVRAGERPTRDEKDLSTDWVPRHCEAHLHAVGTCAMGGPEDPRAVVDVDGRVNGVEGLRVVDASVIPRPPRAPTHLAVVMAAEHVAAGMH